MPGACAGYLLRLNECASTTTTRTRGDTTRFALERNLQLGQSEQH